MRFSHCPTGAVGRPALFTSLLFSVCLAWSMPAGADEAEVDQQIEELLGEHQLFKDTIADLQERVTNEDWVAVSAFIAYPITVTINGRKKTLRSAEAFEPLAADIITPEIAEVIVNQDYGSLFVNSDGIMFGDGQVWMNGICLDDTCSTFEPKIITIQDAQ